MKKIKYNSTLLLTSAHFKELFFWTVYAILIGGVVGIAGCLFEKALSMVTNFRMTHDWVIYLMPVAGLLLVAIYRFAKIITPKGTDRIIVEAQDGKNGVALRVAPIIFVATAISHLVGASVGREGAALQLGGSIASFIGRKIRMPFEDNRTIIQCGMAAGFSALFGAPIAAGVFALEVAASEIYYTSIYPVMLSSVTASVVAKLLGCEGTHFAVNNIPDLTIVTALQSLLMGLVLAGLAVFFVYILEKSICFFSAKFSNQYLKVAIGGIIVVALTLLVGNRDYNGAGMEIIIKALNGEAVSYAFIMKLLMTVICIGCGFKGGEIVPTLFIGSTFGCVFGPLIGMSPEFGAALGMVGLFCGVTNCPMASAFLALELFGGKGLVLAVLCCAVSYTMSGDFSLYHAQKIHHPKFI